jgi:tRNA(fMet)-specific endonuclease VapC
VVVSFQTVAEMRFGARRRNWGEKRCRHLEAFLALFQVEHSSDALLHEWARVMTDGERAGLPINAADAWIAATAKLLGAPLLTHDRDRAPEAFPYLTIHCHASPPAVGAEGG